MNWNDRDLFYYLQDSMITKVALNLGKENKLIEFITKILYREVLKINFDKTILKTSFNKNLNDNIKRKNGFFKFSSWTWGSSVSSLPRYSVSSLGFSSETQTPFSPSRPL